MTLSNITSASAGEASVSSGSHTDHEYDGNETSTPPPPRSMTSTSASTVSSGQQQQPPLAAAGSKRKRNLPGTPDPEAEVIALSPTTLMATNRFVCEICNKGFQRDQNLQLHRRGHNLPWKLRQRSSKEIRKRVYICPEPSCVHHDPSRALGDLTGIKKHFCRKHGEKKWKCDKCSKRYAVQSDWKAHSKTCGTREYRCDCGTLFSRQELVQQIAHGKKCAWHVGNGESRRDSFITHRAFCDALAEDSARVSAAGKRIGSGSDMSSSDMVVQVIGPAAASTMSVIGGGGAAAAAPSSPHTNNLGAAAVSGGDHNSLAASAGAGGGGLGGSPMRSGLLPPSMAASLGRLDEGGLSLLPPQWGSHQAVVGNAPAATTAGAAGPRLSLWLGGPAGGPGQGLPGSQQMQLQQLPGCSDIASSYLMQPPKAIMHLGGGGGTGMQGIPNHALQEYDVPQAPRPLSSSGLLLPMVSSGSTTGSLFAHLFSSAGTSMPGFHATGAASMGMGISGFSDFMTGVNQTERSSATAGLSLSSAAGLSSCSSSVYNDGVGNVPSMSMLFNQQQLQHHHTATAQMSATALLQKAAQMGATASNSSSLLRGFGFGGGDSSSMSLWQGQQQEPARVGDQLPPPNKPSIVQPLQSRRSVEVSPMQTGSPVVVGTSMGPSSFGGSQGRPNEHHAAARIQDFRNSLSGGAGIFAGSLSNMSSMFGPNATLSTGNVGGMMPPSNNRHRMSTNDVMGGHHHHSPYSGAPVSQGMGPSLLPVGLGGGGSTRADDGSDRFTHDFLGVGGANGMAAAAVAAAAAAAAAGGMGRTLSQCDLASITSLGPGVDLGAFFTQRENLRSVGASGHSPGKSWDSS